MKALFYRGEQVHPNPSERAGISAFHALHALDADARARDVFWRGLAAEIEIREVADVI